MFGYLTWTHVEKSGDFFLTFWLNFDYWKSPQKNLILALRILIFGYRHPVKKHHTMKDDGW
jgi:hypothetical protein